MLLMSDYEIRFRSNLTYTNMMQNPVVAGQGETRVTIDIREALSMFEFCLQVCLRHQGGAGLQRD